MRLCELLPAVEDGVLLQGDPRTEVRGLCYDSRRATPGALFVCLPGQHADGHDFAARKTLHLADEGSCFSRSRLILPPVFLSSVKRYARSHHP